MLTGHAVKKPTIMPICGPAVPGLDDLVEALSVYAVPLSLLEAGARGLSPAGSLARQPDGPPARGSRPHSVRVSDRTPAGSGWVTDHGCGMSPKLGRLPWRILQRGIRYPPRV